MEQDPKDQVTNAQDGEIVTNSDLTNLPQELAAQDTDSVENSTLDEETQTSLDDDLANEEIDPIDNPEK